MGGPGANRWVFRRRALAAYVGLVALFQLTVYLAPCLFGLDLASVNPRIGLTFVEIALGFESPWALSWLSRVCLVILAGTMFAREKAVVAFLAVEVLLTLSRLAFLLLALVAGSTSFRLIRVSRYWRF